MTLESFIKELEEVMEIIKSGRIQMAYDKLTVLIVELKRRVK